MTGSLAVLVFALIQCLLSALSYLVQALIRLDLSCCTCWALKYAKAKDIETVHCSYCVHSLRHLQHTIEFWMNSSVLPSDPNLWLANFILYIELFGSFKLIFEEFTERVWSGSKLLITLFFSYSLTLCYGYLLCDAWKCSLSFALFVLFSLSWPLVLFLIH